MFPDKVDKVILDGVQNPHEYYWAYEYVHDTSFPCFTLILT